MAYPTDEEVADAAIRLLADAKLDVLFLHFDDVDGAGHQNGYSPTVEAYLDAIAQIDSYLGDVVGALTTRPTYGTEDWLVVVTTDHGGSDTKGPYDKKYRHGDDVPEHRTVFVILGGDSVLPNGEIQPAPDSVDIPPTVLSYLGVKIDPSWQWDGSSVI